MINTILFDLDNVLVDMSDVHYHCLNKALRYNKCPTISYNEHIKKYNGLPTSKKLDMLNVDQDTKQFIWKQKQKYTMKGINKYLTFDQKKVDMHAALILCGFKLGCVTNSIKQTAKAMLKQTGQYNYMSILISNEDVQKPKPNPEPYILGMNKIKSKPYETLIIEDSPIGKESAVKSKASVMMVPNWKHVTFNNIIKQIDRIGNG